jgi:hypothetical protein
MGIVGDRKQYDIGREPSATKVIRAWLQLPERVATDSVILERAWQELNSRDG